MDEKGANSYRLAEGGNGVVPSVSYKSSQKMTGREKVMLCFSVFLAICTFTLIIGLVVKLEMKTTSDCSSGSPSSVSPNGQGTAQNQGQGPQTQVSPRPTPAPQSTGTPATSGGRAACTSKDCVREAASLINAIDFTVDPCDNFYEFACGNWMRSRTIPDDKSAYQRFTEVRDSVQLKLKVELEKPITSTDIEAVRKVKVMYKSCTNEDVITKRGLHVTEPLLQELGGWPVTGGWDESKFNLVDLLVKLGLYNNMVLIDTGVSPDDKNSSVHIIVIDQAQLGMPSRDYYLKPRGDNHIMVYQNLATEVAVLFGADRTQAEQQMKDMVDFEITIANLTVAQAERRNMDKLYHRMSVSELTASIPGFDWLGYLKGVFEPFNQTITASEQVVVYTPDYIKNMLQVIKKTPSKTVVNYLMWRIMMNRVNNLDERIRDIQRDYNKVIFGTKRMPPKWRMCVDYVNNNMGDAVGRLFIDNYFDRKAKQNAVTMIRYLRDSFENLLRKATWMDEQTRKYALHKAEAILEEIGYPDNMLNDTILNDEYGDVDFNETTYFENVLTLMKDRVRDNAWYLRRLVDREEWTTTPAIVNAFYSPNRNSITFPAAILQPPFYSKEYPMSLIFGGIGMVIGHEITHGFDDEGRQYDMVGNFHQWWTNSSLAKFTNLAKCLVDQYSSFSIKEDHVNGKMTLGENMADNGGIKASFEAYRKWVSENGEEPPLPGLELSHEQLFFVNFAQGWCSLSTDAALHNQIITDPHSPSKFRVIGTVSNSDYFRDAFKCSPKTKMNPDNKCGVW
ncbi:endothelin-converting enzyme homolog isoform X1 [Haliotis rufescens]|uniref:endothelin-converting enzyme homolog isoform X1 n=1 Tax=Haliotis rufescens TaxID=6454 RepID=UPI00201EDA08|nr:endothelin-converting enzyme homolog isoform X1 [Haliotis rufescens]